jgi:chromate transporter
VTFIPCYLYIFVGAPWIEYLRGNLQLNAALSCITAAVVGVILNLACWFALHTMFGQVGATHLGPFHLSVPIWSTIDWAGLVLAAGASIALIRYRIGVLWTLITCLGLGMLWSLLGARHG